MRKQLIVVVGAVLGMATVCVPREAHALGPIDLEVGAKVGYGTNPFGDPVPNPLAFGLGARAGIVALGSYYAGLQFMYYFGSSQGGAEGVSLTAVQYGIEGGIQTSLLGLLTLRGQLGLGNIQINESGTISGNAGHLYLEPGATVILPLGLLFVGADANVLVLPDAADPSLAGHSSWRAAFTFHGQVGLRF